MARLIKCPRCQSQIDVTSVSGGATVRCADCNSMVRVPSGQYPKVEAPAPEPAPVASAKPTRQTALFRKMSGARAPGATGRPPGRAQAMAEHGGGRASRSNNTPLIVGGAIGGLVLIVVLVILVANKKDDKPKKDKTAQTNNAGGGNNTYQEPEQPKDDGKKPADGGKIKKTGGGTYQAPTTFQPGAEKHARAKFPVFPEVKPDETVLAVYDGLAKDGKVAEIVKEDYKYFTCILLRMLHDEERMARSSFQALADICAKWKISSSDGEFRNPVKLEYFNSHEYRGGDYVQWAEWYQKNKETVEIWQYGEKGKVELAPVDSDKLDWNKAISDLKEGGFDDATTPAGLAISRIKRSGRKGLEKLVSLMDPEDLATMRVIASALNHLTGAGKPLPTAGTKGQAKGEWETWLKTH